MSVRWTFEGLQQTGDRAWGRAFQSSVRWNVRERGPQRQACPSRDSGWPRSGLALSQGVGVGGGQGGHGSREPQSGWAEAPTQWPLPGWSRWLCVSPALEEGWDAVGLPPRRPRLPPVSPLLGQEEALSPGSSHCGGGASAVHSLLSRTDLGSVSQLCGGRSKPSPPAGPHPSEGRAFRWPGAGRGALFRPSVGLPRLNRRRLGPPHRCSLGKEKSDEAELAFES